MPCGGTGGHPESGHGPGRAGAACHGVRAKPTNRAAAAGGRQSSVTCMHALVVDTPIRFLGPWRSRRDDGRGLCRVPAVPRRGCERQAREQAGTGTCAPTPAASGRAGGRQATQGAHSLRLLSAARPTSNRSSRPPPPPPHPPLSSSPCSRCAARVVPSHHCRLLQRHHHLTPSGQTPRHSSSGRERERQRSPSSPTPACFLPGCLAPSTPLSLHSQQSRSQAPAC